MTKQHAGKHIAKATAWTMVGRMLSMCLKFITVPILARILMPEEFGIIAASITVVFFVTMLGGLGLPSALIADKRDLPSLWNQVFTFTFLIGCLLAAALFWSAETVSEWLGATDIERVLKVLCLLIPLQILGDVSEATLTKRMQFDKMAIWQVVADTVAALSAIAAALAQWGVWALVIQQLVSAVIRVSGNLYAAGFFPRPAWSFDNIRSLGHFGSRVMLSDLLLYLCIQGPVAIVTRMLGTHATGFFSVPNRFVELPNQIIVSSLATVLFPSFASMADQPKRLASALLRSAQLTSALQAPLLFGLAAVAEPAMDLLFGDKWIEAWPIFAILALSKGAMAPCGGFGAFLKGVGRADILWQVMAVRALLVTCSCIIGAIIGGLVGLVTGILIANIIFMLGYSSTVFRIAKISILRSLAKVLWPLIQALIMAGTVYYLRILLIDVQLAFLAELAISVLVGGLVYGGMVLLFQQTTKETITKLLGKRQEPAQK